MTKVLRAPVLKDFYLNSVAMFRHHRTNSGHFSPAAKKASSVLRALAGWLAGEGGDELSERYSKVLKDSLESLRDISHYSIITLV